jgi:hypothetical protein
MEWGECSPPVTRNAQPVMSVRLQGQVMPVQQCGPANAVCGGCCNGPAGSVAGASQPASPPPPPPFPAPLAPQRARVPSFFFGGSHLIYRSLEARIFYKPSHQRMMLKLVAFAVVCALTSAQLEFELDGKYDLKYTPEDVRHRFSDLRSNSPAPHLSPLSQTSSSLRSQTSTLWS